MKKVLLLCMVCLFSSIGFAQRGNPEAMMKERNEKLVKELKLEGEKADQFKKIQAEFMENISKEFEKRSEDRSGMREMMTKLSAERDAKVKELLTEEEFKKYTELNELDRRNRPQRGR